MVIAEPVFVPTVKATDSCAFPGVITIEVGAPGATSGVAEDEEEGALFPARLTARI